jgi:NTP pyrophosphatase (non-canonical NTP hydrolase)
MKFRVLNILNLFTRFMLVTSNKSWMNDFEEITETLLKFRNERDWAQFHNSKDLALAINVEAAELLELFLWKAAEEANVEKVKEELADVLAFAFLLAEKYSFDVKKIILDKIAKNAEKYPVDKARGTARKYNEL